MTTTSTNSPTVAPERDGESFVLAGAGRVAVPVLDRIAMRVGLALLVWGRHHAETPRRTDPPRPTFVADARWYMR